MMLFEKGNSTPEQTVRTILLSLTEFGPFTHAEAQETLKTIRVTTCVMDLCPSWLVKVSAEQLYSLLMGIVNAYSREILLYQAP